MRFPTGIALRVTLLGWMVTLLTLGVFVLAIVPEQKREFELGLASKARGVAASIRGAAAGAAVSEDYSEVVDQAMQVLSGDLAIDYVVMTKNDGFSIVIDRSNWKTETLGATWYPAVRVPASSIGTSSLFQRRVFQYALPFDYSGIQWGWIHIGLSLNSYDESVHRTYQRTGALAVVCGALSLLISLVFAARLVRPIQVLHAAVERVAKGDLYARAEVHSGDEIEQVATAFNDMAQTILGRNQILESVGFSAKRFLSDGDGDTVLGAVLERVGQAAGVSRACVLKMSMREGRLCPSMHREWLPAGTPPDQQKWQDFPWEERGAAWVEVLKQGGSVSVAPGAMEQPLRGLVDSRILSTIFVPVVVAGRWWGLAGFDDFVQEREWGEAERDSLQAVADMLGASIARRRVRNALLESKDTLELRVIERTRELQEQVEAKDRAHAELAAAQQRLIELSREAGMAEVATGVLHNVGNVLNSVNVSATIAAGRIGELRLDKLVAAIGLLNQPSDVLADFLTRDPKGLRVIPYLTKLGTQLEGDRLVSLKELEQLRSHVGHIKEIVATQQSFAKVCGLIEMTSLTGVAEDALRIVEPSFERHQIRLEREFETLPDIAVDKHRALQILLNLLRNAKESVKEGGRGQKRIKLRIHQHGDTSVRMEVSDSGVGLDQQQLTRIFAHGFTTKRDGHGFGLHSGALAARQMKGSLWAESEGPGLGATFVLELPMSEVLEGSAV
ncbi:MAG: ATP-binding protein [Candidatus Solibacter sp.]